MPIKQIAYLIAASVCWLAFFWSTYQGIKQHQKTQLHRLFLTKCLLLAFALAITFRIQSVHSTLTRLTGVNNISLLFSYFTAIVAITLVVQFLYARVFPAKDFSWLYISAGITLMTMLATFPLVARSPDIYDSGMTPDNAVLLFRIIFYAYAGWLCTLTAVRYHQLRQDTMPLPTRLRWYAGMVGMVTAVFYCIGRALAAGLVWAMAAPQTSAAFNLLHTINAIVFVVSASLWALFFAGGLLFQQIARLEKCLEAMKTLRDIRKVGVAAAAYGGYPLPRLAFPWWCYREVGLHIHQVIISILGNQRKMSIALCADSDTDPALSAVYALLEAVEQPPLTDYQALVNAYRKLGNQIADS